MGRGAQKVILCRFLSPCQQRQRPGGSQGLFGSQEATTRRLPPGTCGIFSAWYMCNNHCNSFSYCCFCWLWKCCRPLQGHCPQVSPCPAGGRWLVTVPQGRAVACGACSDGFNISLLSVPGERGCSSAKWPKDLEWA